MHGSSKHHQHSKPKAKKEHFHGGSILDHILHKRAEGLLILSESHSLHVPTWLNICIYATKDTTIIALLLAFMLHLLQPNADHCFAVSIAIMLGWLTWKMGHTAWMGWMKLERLHRILEEEREELAHNREQEKEELKTLYAAKGLSGALLDEVIDVIMADDQRALAVMLQEELGLVLASYDHPLQQSMGAAFGVLLPFFFMGLGALFFSFIGACVAATFILLGTTFLAAALVQNRIIQALVWNSGLGMLAIMTAYFSWQALLVWQKLG